MHSADYLNVTLNWNDFTYHPFHNPHGETTYTYVESNHSQKFIRKTSKSIDTILTCQSSKRKIFANSKDYY